MKKVLIANRGEIAVRIIRACRNLGLASVAVYSTADKDSLHVKLADESVCIGPGPSRDSYLNMGRLLSAAAITGADAIHPGAGFLSENSTFCRLCGEEGLTFIGPSPEIMEKMGDKLEARNTMAQAGVPVTPGVQSPVFSGEEGIRIAEKIGYPVMIKATAGGGGKGIRVARTPDDFLLKFTQAQKEAKNGFANDGMYIEKFIENPRHVEFQVLADACGNTVCLGERDCSVQRKYQKMIEESPSPFLSGKLREEMAKAAVRAAKAAHYVSAGTVEFLLDQEGRFYFMEMNTRIQVEHGVTEMVTGVDLIEAQIRIAMGKPLGFSQQDVQISGHAIECRINAEMPAKNFLPCPGTITQVHLPGGNGVRVDTAIYPGYRIPSEYDSMIAKVICHGKDRESAIRRMKTALSELVIDGVGTNMDFQYTILNNPVFQSGMFDTGFIETYYG